MKRLFFAASACLLMMLLGALPSKAQSVSGQQLPVLASPVPWAESELLAPATLARDVKSHGRLPLVFNIGFMEDIKGATHIGPVSRAEGMEKFKKTLDTLPKTTEIVIYCGCCPLYKCPNVRPAYLELKKAGFKNIKVLNLTTNLKTNWIGMGYPLAKAK